MTDTEQLLSDSIDKISELSIENHRLKAQIEELKKIEEEYYDFIQKKNEEDWKGDNVVGCLKLKIEQLKAQIEKMKCCEICAKYKDWRNRSLCVECEQSKSHINFELRR